MAAVNVRSSAAISLSASVCGNIWAEWYHVDAACAYAVDIGMVECMHMPEEKQLSLREEMDELLQHVRAMSIKDWIIDILIVIVSSVLAIGIVKFQYWATALQTVM